MSERDSLGNEIESGAPRNDPETEAALNSLEESQDQVEETPPQTISEIPNPDEIESASDLPDPIKDIVTDEAWVKQAEKDNSIYWETQNLAMAGRIQDEVDFLPGRSVSLQTPDDGMLIWIGKQIDKEFGRIDPRIGISASYDDGVIMITLSVVTMTIDGEDLYTPVSSKEDPMNRSLSINERELALSKKSMAVRRKWQLWPNYVIGKIYNDCYKPLLKRQEVALKLLPFYSPIGERLPELELPNLEGT